MISFERVIFTSQKGCEVKLAAILTAVLTEEFWKFWVLSSVYVCPSKQLQLDAATDVKVQVHITLHSGSENFWKIQAKKNSSNEMDQIFFLV